MGELILKVSVVPRRPTDLYFVSPCAAHQRGCGVQQASRDSGRCIVHSVPLIITPTKFGYQSQSNVIGAFSNTILDFKVLFFNACFVKAISSNCPTWVRVRCCHGDLLVFQTSMFSIRIVVKIIVRGSWGSLIQCRCVCVCVCVWVCVYLIDTELTALRSLAIVVLIPGEKYDCYLTTVSLFPTLATT